jgi:hypothetical protein
MTGNVDSDMMQYVNLFELLFLQLSLRFPFVFVIVMLCITKVQVLVILMVVEAINLTIRCR